MLLKNLSAFYILATAAHAHMFLVTPARFATPVATNGPISSSNFPCQASGYASFSSDTIDSAGATEMALGSNQPLAFEGQSVHGGGSCQFSLTYDENPTDNSIFKVITSIEGGCVAQDTVGNLGSDSSATAPDPYTYNFTIPSDIPTGNAVIAWTWFNKVGNREMYMQCAPVTLTGTSGDKSNYDALPNLFVANLDNDASTCHTPSDTDLVFPDPGNIVYRLNGATTAWGSPTGQCASGTTASASSNIVTTTGATAKSNVTSTKMGDEGLARSGAVAGAPTNAYISYSGVPTDIGSTQALSSSSLSSFSSLSSSSVQTGVCSAEGDYVCLDHIAYQVCASGAWSVSMDMARGTECSGSGSDFTISASIAKASKGYV